MGSYKIQLLKSADRDIRKIDKQQVTRVRVDDYRVICEVDKAKNIIEIFYVRHRKDTYRK